MSKPDPAELWRNCNQACLAFDGGSLLIKPDGSGWFAFMEADSDWERDDETGKDIIVANFAAGEAQELRDYLCKWFPAQGIEAGTGETACGLDPKDESPVGNADAPKGGPRD